MITKPTQKTLEVSLVIAVNAVLNDVQDNSYMRGYATGIQEALGLTDSEVRTLVKEYKEVNSA